MTPTTPLPYYRYFVETPVCGPIHSFAANVFCIFSTWKRHISFCSVQHTKDSSTKVFGYYAIASSDACVSHRVATQTTNAKINTLLIVPLTNRDARTHAH
jgi:hypothetical protein